MTFASVRSFSRCFSQLQFRRASRSIATQSLLTTASTARAGYHRYSSPRSLFKYKKINPVAIPETGPRQFFSLHISPATTTCTQRRSYADLKASGGKTEADLLVDELQELYDNAKDEFEIATDSTNSATIYAASDRESAREMLDQLLYVYKVYTEMTRSSAAAGPERVSPPQQNEPSQSPNAGQANADRLDANAAGNPNNPNLENAIATATGEALQGESYVGVAPNYDPEEISVEVKEEVKKRVGQRIRELKSAVERLEQMASHE